MALMARHNGHFFNWYDTQERQRLSGYVSTVDSGNLIAHLLTLRAGLLTLADEGIVGVRWFDGLHDTYWLLVDAVGSDAAAGLADFERALGVARSASPASLGSTWRHLDVLLTAARAVAAAIDSSSAAPGEAKRWSEALVRQCKAGVDELALLAPGVASGDGQAPEAEPRAAAVSALPTLRELVLCGGDCSTSAPAVAARARIVAIDALIAQATEFSTVDYEFLFDRSRRLLSIGYDVVEQRRDASFYDLLASEARVCSFVGIAQGRLPQENWFALGRMLTRAGGTPTLLSWSGSMFEYLMPSLIMPSFANTLLDQTYHAAVQRQIEYGRRRGVPWGISECAYNTVDVALNYQYRAFGVPGLGLKSGLAEDLVIAPYASALALTVKPLEACANIERMISAGFAGSFGFYDAIDYTPSRVPRGQPYAIVQAFMAHHQGMTLLALLHVLEGGAMRRRFESDPLFQSAMLLLQERVPRATGFYAQAVELADLRPSTPIAGMALRTIGNPETPTPELQLLSNGRLHVMVTAAGGGYSRWGNFQITRWREDPTRDSWGAFCYIRDVSSGAFWSAAHQPTGKRADRYEAIFSESRAEFRRRDGEFETHTEIAVSPEDDIELRRIRIINRARSARTIDVTSYAEVVLAPPAADAQARAFGNLFVQTEILPQKSAILCTRRPRSANEAVPWMFHLMKVHGDEGGAVSYETDRSRFIGRCNTTAAPAAMMQSAPLSGSAGSVLDPVAAIRRGGQVKAGASLTVDIVTGISETREGCLALIDKYQDPSLAERVFDLAWTHSSVTLRQLNASEAEAQLYNRLAAAVLYANPALRADPSVIKKNRRGQSGLWSYAISGDPPIVLLQIEDAANIGLVRQMIRAHAYWRQKGLAVDLVIWNEDHSGYRQALHDQITGLIAAGVEAHVLDRPGGIFVRRGEQIADEDRLLFQTVARAVIVDRLGTLAEQVGRRLPLDAGASRPAPLALRRREMPSVAEERRPALVFGNGLGGFSSDGREYVIVTDLDTRTPAPWSNVLANPDFGCVVSESGQAYTWSENAHEFRLTPWQNDPVGDGAGEAFYIRDEESRYYWSPTPLPAKGATPYTTRHGFGYSVFEHAEEGVVSELQVFVALDAPVKFTVLKLRNETERSRRLSVTGYVEWVLGDLPAKTGMHVITEFDARSGVLFARNPYNSEFPRRTAFFDVDAPTRSVTGDRGEFIGRTAALDRPAAMIAADLSGRVGPALDPCGAIRVACELGPGEAREFVFRLGAGRDADDAAVIALRHQGRGAARDALEKVSQYWRQTLGAVQVSTPDTGLNFLANGWLVYQVLACRLWARSGYYQSGGAFGFRDQLQDVMALMHCEPRLAREHLLRCAAHQFAEGDVLHWWHPPLGRGVRSMCSDDFLWLPLATCRYVEVTGDASVLDESVHFIDGRPLAAGEDSYYDLPSRSETVTSLYDHCVRALVHGMRYGERGLPLMGSGDWNDAMNLVGIQGKGESVWLAFFLHRVLKNFTELARSRNDFALVERCDQERQRLRSSIAQHGWDGAWYRRAYFDDGTPLGSGTDPECRIDSIAQSWAVLSGIDDGDRPRLAMDAVDRHLVARDEALVRLLEPPFDQSPLDPGYIKGYAPGVRENGGQYTHAAIWAAMAFAALGDAKRAEELLSAINPINHAKTADAVAVFKTEPFVIAADVYSRAPHTGRGGWTWYTGSAGWMYRLIVESLIGLKVRADTLAFAPCLPATWPRVELDYRYKDTIYHIEISRSPETLEAAQLGCDVRVVLDDIEQTGSLIKLVDDRARHVVQVNLAFSSDNQCSDRNVAA
jgi:cellobiose phosphorylase